MDISTRAIFETELDLLSLKKERKKAVFGIGRERKMGKKPRKLKSAAISQEKVIFKRIAELAFYLSQLAFKIEIRI